MTTHIMLDLETWGRTPGSDIRSIGAVVFDPIAGEVSLTCETCKNGQGNISTWSGDCSDCLNTRLQSGYGATFYVACDNPTLIELENVKERHGAIDEWAAWDGSSNCYRKYPLTRKPETVKWWSEQSPEAQGAFANPVDMREALDQFTDWIIDLLRNDRHSIAKADFIDGNFDMSGLRIWANDPHFDVSILDAAYRAVQLPTPWHFRSPRSFRTVVELSGMTSEDKRQFDTGTAHNALDDAISQAKIVCEAYRRLGLQP